MDGMPEVNKYYVIRFCMSPPPRSLFLSRYVPKTMSKHRLASSRIIKHLEFSLIHPIYPRYRPNLFPVLHQRSIRTSFHPSSSNSAGQLLDTASCSQLEPIDSGHTRLLSDIDRLLDILENDIGGSDVWADRLHRLRHDLTKGRPKRLTGEHLNLPMTRNPADEQSLARKKQRLEILLRAS